MSTFRSSRKEVFLGKGILKIYSKFTGEDLWRNVISIKLLQQLIEITLRHGCSPVNLPYIFKTPFLKNKSGWLLLNITTTPMKWNYYNLMFKGLSFDSKMVYRHCTKNEVFH